MIMDLPLSIAKDYLIHAIEQEKEQYAWELWKTIYPNMQSGQMEFIKFDDFKNKLFEKQQKYTHKSKEDIEAEMLKIVDAHKKRR